MVDCFGLSLYFPVQSVYLCGSVSSADGLPPRETPDYYISHT